MENRFLTKIALNRYEEHLLGKYSKPSEVPAEHNYRYRAAVSSHMGHGENQRDSVNKMLPLARQQSRAVNPGISTATRLRAKLPVVPVNLPKDKATGILSNLKGVVKKTLMTKVALNRYEDHLLGKYSKPSEVPAEHRARYVVAKNLQAKPNIGGLIPGEYRWGLEENLQKLRSESRRGMEGVGKPRTLAQRIEAVSKPVKKAKLPRDITKVKTPLATKILAGAGAGLAVSAVGYGIKKLVDE